MAKKFIVVFVLLVIAAGAAYWYWTGTPQYSVLQLCDAVKKHDGLVFRTYFDVDGVSSRAVDDLLSESVREIGGAGLLQKLVGMTFARFLKPELSTSLSKKIMDFVEHQPEKTDANNADDSKPSNRSSADTEQTSSNDGPLSKAVSGFVRKIAEAVKPPSPQEVLNNLGITKENFKGFTDYEVSGNLCRVGLKFQAPDRPLITVMLELEKKDNHWQVVRFANIAQIAQTASGI